MTNKGIALTGVALLMVGVVGHAHHSVAMFDQTKKVMLEGTVKEFQWTNPHVWLQIMAPDSKGTVVEQGFEIGAPNTLIRDGFRKTSFKEGDKVKVLAAPRRDGTVGGLYLCGRTTEGKWLVFGMGPNSVPPAECKD
ncbi:MAG: DUF6152 family protein [Steroidobacteraceae bacterium]